MSTREDAILGLVRVGYQIELVDLFAMAYISGTARVIGDSYPAERAAAEAYDTAEAMIAERKRRYECTYVKESSDQPLSPDVPLPAEDDCPF